MSRNWLGFDGEKSPEEASSRKQRGKRLDALTLSCQEKVSEYIFPLIQDRITKQLPDTDSWELSIDDDDLQTIYFRAPSESNATEEYIQRRVKLEMGARSDDWPTEKKLIQPYVANAFPDKLSDFQCQVVALSIERTFWEKATILHAECHRPDEKATPPRYSRHYYDLAMLAGHAEASKAILRADLRDRVAKHKQIFFPASWAKYELVVPGSIFYS